MGGAHLDAQTHQVRVRGGETLAITPTPKPPAGRKRSGKRLARFRQSRYTLPHRDAHASLAEAGNFVSGSARHKGGRGVLPYCRRLSRSPGVLPTTYANDINTPITIITNSACPISQMTPPKNFIAVSFRRLPNLPKRWRSYGTGAPTHTHNQQPT